MRVGARADGHADLRRRLDRRHAARRLGPALLAKLLAAEVHRVLHRPADAERLHAPQASAPRRR